MKEKLFSYISFYQWWKSIDKPILSLILILFLAGLFFSLVSTSLIASDKLDTNTYFFFFKHIVFVFFGFFLIFFLSFIPEKEIYRISVIFFCLSLVLLFLVPIIGVEIKGSKRWIDLLVLPRIQPIEFVKPFFIIMLALIISNKSLTNLVTKFIFSLLLTLLVSFLLIIQPDLGQTLLITFSWLMLIFVSGVNLILLSSITIFVLTSLLYATFNVPKFEYIKNRLLSFFNSENGTHNFQSDKAIDSITSGGFFGKGIGEGTLKNRVPEAHTDYIISVISEEFGVIAIILILVLFLTFAYSILKKVENENDETARLILIGSSCLILLQSMIHIGVNIRLFPTTGMTLPFLSYGGSSIISISVFSGIILNLTKRKVQI
jgi:cell division protein FtsW